MFISYQLLLDNDACYSQLRLFREIFPEGIEVTKEACVLVADKFDWDWAASFSLSKEDRKAYEAAIGPAKKAYHEAMAFSFGSLAEKY
jgi:hypothetical protein